MPGLVTASSGSAGVDPIRFIQDRGAFDHQTWLVQDALAKLGLWKGPVDGNFTPQFQAFFAEWQQQAQRQASQNISSYEGAQSRRGPNLDGGSVTVADPM